MLGINGDDSNCDHALCIIYLSFQAVVYTAQLNAVKEVIAAGPESNPGN